MHLKHPIWILRAVNAFWLPSWNVSHMWHLNRVPQSPVLISTQLNLLVELLWTRKNLAYIRNLIEPLTVYKQGVELVPFLIRSMWRFFFLCTRRHPAQKCGKYYALWLLLFQQLVMYVSHVEHIFNWIHFIFKLNQSSIWKSNKNIRMLFSSFTFC